MSFTGIAANSQTLGSG